NHLTGRRTTFDPERPPQGRGQIDPAVILRRRPEGRYTGDVSQETEGVERRLCGPRVTVHGGTSSCGERAARDAVTTQRSPPPPASSPAADGRGETTYSLKEDSRCVDCRLSSRTSRTSRPPVVQTEKERDNRPPQAVLNTSPLHH
ncbi:hypothetical protein NHX12_026310, partial [Muraenolepis orangiensis]